ncbi:hypothetical protein CLOM_g15379 [Closterium sp. NIES-68]|nr:hypothetical protein CLOM_g15379 [Closterium sp. NIES-68]GJP58111.1 hypothetical protein CLOP_g20633 [Closterium sp. NIES-67]
MQSRQLAAVELRRSAMQSRKASNLFSPWMGGLLPFLALVGLATALAAPVTATDGERCDITAGEWLYSPRHAPQYTAESCKSLGRDFACQRNGRPDSEYLKYIWRSFGCRIADFKPLSFLTLMRNKVFLIVGDSLTMNLFSSLQCLVETVTLTQDLKGPLFPGGPETRGIIAPAFNATFLRHPSSFLTNSKPDGEKSSASTWTVHLDEVHPDWSPLLQYSHYVLFGTGTWYTMADLKKRRYMLNNTLQPEMDRIVTMQIAINTVIKFTRSLNYTGMPMFLTFTPMHYHVKLNESMQDANCSVIQQPLTVQQIANMEWAVDAVGTRKAQLKVFQHALEFKIIDITTLSLYRADGHLQSYFDIKGGIDCLHWCIPGVPDTWANIIYSYMMGYL